MSTGNLFVYGLLRKDANHSMGQFLRESADFISEATFQGRLYQIDYYPGVVASSIPEELVKGDLYKISDPKLLAILDEFEGVGSAFDSPNEYERKTVEVRLADESKTQAWIYLYNWSLRGSKVIPSGDFLNP